MRAKLGISLKVQDISSIDFLTPEWTPKVVQQLLKVGLKAGAILGPFSDFESRFWVDFGNHFGVKHGQRAPRWTHEGHQELQSTEKQHLQICNLTMQKPYFLSLATSQDEHERLRKAPKGHLKSLKISKKGSKHGPEQIIFGPSFGADLGPNMNPKIYPLKNGQKT